VPRETMTMQSRVTLGTWPTPVEPAPRLAAAIGLRPGDLWVKRDDLTGLGAGGNKIRKLEWTIGAALAEGADTVVTTGAPQSNHARLTAAAAARTGLDAVLVFPGVPGTSRSGNLALDGLFGARVAWAGDAGPDGLAAAAARVARQLQHQGRRVAVIPFGGSSSLAARGYAECGRELLDQVPDLRTAVVAVGSGATMAGLVAAIGADRVLGVDTGAIPDPLPTVASFASEAGGTLVTSAQLAVRRDQVGGGYGDYPAQAAAALQLAARTEGLVLDPVYTARALAGLAAAVRDGQVAAGQRTVFVHTGGLPGLFGHAAAIEQAQHGLEQFPLDMKRRHGKA